MAYEFKERDWKLFRKKLPGWQEAFMEKLIEEYTAILTDENTKASAKFWEMDRRIRKDKEQTGVMIISPSRRFLKFYIVQLCSEGAVTLDDLKDFSEELQEEIREYLQDL